MARSAPKAPRSAIRPRVYLGPAVKLGPGKIDLLRHVAARRSIAGAARAMDMSYKRAWQLIDAMNRDFGAVVATATGGAGGGGAALTPKGAALVAAYDALERRVNEAAEAQIAVLAALLPSRRTR